LLSASKIIKEKNSKFPAYKHGRSKK